MWVKLTFSTNGRVAILRAKNGLDVARFSVQGPFKRNAESIVKGFDEPFCAEVRGIGDDEYIDLDTGEIRKVREC